MQKKVKNFLTAHNLIGKTLVLGYSTGVDSTVLLHLLSKIKDIKLIAAHLNHNWRGAQSKKDEEFARKMCKDLDVEFYTETLSDDIKKTETSAREERYKFFENCAKKFNAQGILLAHNLNDNIETLIYRIAKGTGLEGLRSIPVVRDKIYRPMLDISRDEIEKYAKVHKLKFREDSSNSDIKYKRNFIRHKVLPLLEEINPTYKNSLNNLITVANYECEIVDDKIEEVKELIFKEGKIQTPVFAKLKKAYKIKILQNYIKDELKNPNLKKIEQILEFIEDEIKKGQDPQFRKWKTFSLNSKKFLYVNKKEIFKE